MKGSRTVARVAASWVLAAAAGLASAQTFTEGFDNVAALPAAGWLQVNNGAPPREPWSQGVNTAAIVAFEGAPSAYVSANYLSSDSGAIDNWLISPVLNISAASQLSFVTRSSAEGPFVDILEVLWSSGTRLVLNGFTSLSTIGSSALYPTPWTEFVLALPDVASGRFAFRQRGANETSSYIGVDSVRVTLAVAPIPEPETWALMGAGLAALSLFARRRARGMRSHA